MVMRSDMLASPQPDAPERRPRVLPCWCAFALGVCHLRLTYAHVLRQIRGRQEADLKRSGLVQDVAAGVGLVFYFLLLRQPPVDLVSDGIEGNLLACDLRKIGGEFLENGL